MFNRIQPILLAFALLLLATTSWAQTQHTLNSCGTSGDEQARINNCGKTKTSKAGVDWVLVTRTISKTGHLLSFWKDMAEEGKIWSDIFETTYGWHDALRACTAYDLLQGEKGLPQKYWELPSDDDYELAEEHGIRDILEMKNSAGEPGHFWTSEKNWLSLYDDEAESFFSETGVIENEKMKVSNPFRCIAITR